MCIGTTALRVEHNTGSPLSPTTCNTRVNMLLHNTVSTIIAVSARVSRVSPPPWPPKWQHAMSCAWRRSVRGNGISLLPTIMMFSLVSWSRTKTLRGGTKKPNKRHPPLCGKSRTLSPFGWSEWFADKQHGSSPTEKLNPCTYRYVVKRKKRPWGVGHFFSRFVNVLPFY